MNRFNPIDHMGGWGWKLGGILGLLYGIALSLGQYVALFGASVLLFGAVFGCLIGGGVGYLLGVVSGTAIKWIFRGHSYPVDNAVIEQKRWLVLLASAGIGGFGISLMTMLLAERHTLLIVVVVPSVIAAVSTAFAAYRFLHTMAQWERPRINIDAS